MKSYSLPLTETFAAALAPQKFVTPLSCPRKAEKGDRCRNDIIDGLVDPDESDQNNVVEVRKVLDEIDEEPVGG